MFKAKFKAHPEQLQHAEDAFMHSATVDDYETMTTAGRAIYSKLKDPQWARAAAWASSQSPTSSAVAQQSLKISNLLLTMSNRQEPLDGRTNAEIIGLNLDVSVKLGDHTSALKLIDQYIQTGDLRRLCMRMDTIRVILEHIEGEQRALVLKNELDWVCNYLSSTKDKYVLSKPYQRA